MITAQLSDDLLEGGSAIAEFLFGDAGQAGRVYHLAATKRIPCFRMGRTLVGRKSTLLAWISRREQEALAGYE